MIRKQNRQLFNIKKKLVFSKFAIDSYYNFISVALLSFCGLLINFLIARQFGPSALGVFNQTYSIYMIVSQIASLGVQVSVLKHVTQLTSENESLDEVISSAIIITIISTTFFSVLLLQLRWPIASILDSNETAASIIFIVPGLFFLSLNKIFFSIL